MFLSNTEDVPPSDFCRKAEHLYSHLEPDMKKASPRAYCNIGSPEDVAAVQSNDGQRTGLFRSEFLYSVASDYPIESTSCPSLPPLFSPPGGEKLIMTLCF